MREAPPGLQGTIHAPLRLRPRLLNWSGCKLSPVWSAGDTSWSSVVVGRVVEDRERALGRRRGRRVREDAAERVVPVLELIDGPGKRSTGEGAGPLSAKRGTKPRAYVPPEGP